MIEIEKRFKSTKEINEKLSNGNETYLLNQYDKYFDNIKDSYLLENPISKWLRIREYSGNFREITFKEYNHNTGQSVEIDLEIIKIEAGEKILKSLGFVYLIDVKKEREIIELNEAYICLDNVENLGYFIEIEVKEQYNKYAEKIIQEMIEKLEIQNLEEITQKGYPQMILEKEGKL